MLTFSNPNRLFPQPQTAIASSPSTKPDRLNLNIRPRSPLITYKT
ncbi:MAG: hypothetical protein ACKPCM_01415 [Pseudanabaena sp.]